jgi:hypothetical protein
VGHYAGLRRQAKTVKAIAVAKEDCFHSCIVCFGAAGSRPGAKNKTIDTAITRHEKREARKKAAATNSAEAEVAIIQLRIVTVPLLTRA